jgi:hypothetical protein
MGLRVVNGCCISATIDRFLLGIVVFLFPSEGYANSINICCAGGYVAELLGTSFALYELL